MTSGGGVLARGHDSVLLEECALTGVLCLLSKQLVDLLPNLAIWDLDVVLLVAVVRQQVQEAVLGDIELKNHTTISIAVSTLLSCLSMYSTHKLVLLTPDIWHVHVVGGGGEILQLLAGKKINGSQVDLGVTVLAGLGGGHVDDLAGAVLDHDEAVLAQSRTLHRVGERGAGVGGVELELML